MRRSACIVALALGMLSPAGADTFVLTPVAVQRQEAPVGGRYILFGDLSIDSLRRVTFSASLSRGQNGIFRTRRGGLETLVLSGDPAPPDAGNRFAALFEVSSNAPGDLAFTANTFFPQRVALFLMTDGMVRTVARAGDPSPTATGDIFTGFDQIRLLDTGDLYFSAGILEAGGGASSAIFRVHDGLIESVVAPGDRFMGTRAIDRTSQYDVTPSGRLTLQAAVVDSGFLDDGGAVGEVLEYVDGRLRTLASVGLSVSGGIDLIRNFAVTFDQVRADDAGRSYFYAGTNDFPLGVYLLNETGRLYDNHRLLSQGDPVPASPADRLAALGAFDVNAAGTLVAHALTDQHPDGTLLVRRAGEDRLVAAAGEPRPDGTGSWHGFQRIELGEDHDDSFVFTDFEAIAQVGVFLGRFVPPAGIAIERLERALEQAGLPGLFRPIGDAFARGHTAVAVRLAEALLVELDRRAGRSISLETADRIGLELDDVIFALGGPSLHGPGGPPAVPRARPARMPRGAGFDTDPGRH